MFYLVKDVSVKYTSLRTQYVKQKNKIVASSRSGAGTAGVAKATWKYFEALHFLGDTVAVDGQRDSMTSSIPAATTSDNNMVS